MRINSTYYNNLIKAVMDNSEATTWDEAVNEWSIEDVEEDSSLSYSCICGKEHLRYLFTIKNKYNCRLLFPIGSSCIKKFNRDDLDEEVSIKEQLFVLLHAIETKRFINLSSEFFSRKLLYYFYNNDVFTPSNYNSYNPYNDYEFLLDMFNKRSSPSCAQQKKISAIIMNSIYPYLAKLLEKKIIK